MAAADAVQVGNPHTQPRQHSQLEIEHPLLNSITVLMHLYLCYPYIGTVSDANSYIYIHIMLALI